MKNNKNVVKKRTLKQWIYRYLIVFFIIGSLATVVITTANAAYRKSVSSTDSARVAKWSFTFNDKSMAEIESEPIDILQNSYYEGVSQYIENDSNSYNVMLVPGMMGSVTYQIENESEVDAALANFSVEFQYLIQKPSADMYNWDNDDWVTWVDSLPIEWFVIMINGTQAISNLVRAEITSKLNTGAAHEHLGNSILVHLTWNIVTQINDTLDFKVGDDYKIIQIYWKWPFDRQTEYMFYDERKTTPDVSRTLTYEDYINLPGLDLSQEPTFTYERYNSTELVTRTFTEMTFDYYLNLFNYCRKIEDFSMLYKYHNYQEYLKWKMYFKVPDDYETDVLDNYKRQEDYLADIDTNLSNLDVNISAILSLTYVQKEPE